MTLEPHEKMILGLMLIAIGFGICGRFLIFFYSPAWNGLPSLNDVLTSLFSVPFGSIVLNIADILELLCLLIFLYGVKELA